MSSSEETQREDETHLVESNGNCEGGESDKKSLELNGGGKPQTKSCNQESQDQDERENEEDDENDENEKEEEEEEVNGDGQKNGDSGSDNEISSSSSTKVVKETECVELNDEEDSGESINDHLNDDDDEEEDDDEIEEVGQVHNGSSSANNRRKAPLNVRHDIDSDEMEEEDDSEDEEANDVEEIKDDDSDIMEVDAEESNTKKLPAKNTSLDIKSKSGNSTNIVTIDDVTTLHKLAGNARNKEQHSSEKSNNLVVLDTNSILAGKSTSGVTITPARPKQMPNLQALPSGVTISQTKSGKGVAFGNDKKGELNDPNLTDDTFVVEAPSFIVPYVYEKPPKETFTDFKSDIRKLIIERAKKRKEEKAKKKEDKRNEQLEKKKAKKAAKKDKDDPDYDSKEDDDDDDDSESAKSSNDSASESSSGEEEDIVEIKPERKSDSFFDSALGNFFTNLGMNLVQESVQTDLLKQQIRKSQKDKSATVMHAIMSLRKNLETSKETNQDYKFELKKCKYCSFKTESKLVLDQHYETPHMKNNFYRCNFCHYDTKMPQEVLTHMMMEHGIRGKLERAPAIHQCPQCPFEDNMKGKLTRHKTGCDKRFRPERNQEQAYDWEPPAKIPKPPVFKGRPNPLSNFPNHPNTASLNNRAHMMNQKGAYPGLPSLQLGGRQMPPILNRGPPRPIGFSAGRPMVGGQYMNNQVVLQALNQGGSSSARNHSNSSVLLPHLNNSGSVTIQSLNQRSRGGGGAPPSISITPLPGRGNNMLRPNSGSSSLMKPGQPNSASGKGNLVICEICDGFIKDLEQLRNHMQWIHKVKIHPKMIYNRPPLNCQKCQYRFFTDQGLERHLLGSHGLVTASMQDLANKGQDSGRCPVCGKVYQWKLLNHVAKDHQKTLKPAHLSYKCTVCTATFNQYKLFENHVYTAHSGAAKKVAKNKQPQRLSGQSSSSSSVLKSGVNSDEITVIPTKKSLGGVVSKDKIKFSSNQVTISKMTKAPDVIELDDEEETEGRSRKTKEAEIIDLDTPAKSPSGSKAASITEDDDDEEEDEEEANSTSSVKRSADESSSSKKEEPKAKKPREDNHTSDDGGVEEIEEEDDEDDEDQ